MNPPKAATTSPPSTGPGLCLLLACSCGSPGIPAVNTLQGEEAFSLEAVAAYYNPLFDGGPDLSSFAIQASDRLPSFCGAADAGAAGPSHEINVEITARPGEVVSPGTFPIGLPPEIQPPFAEISLSILQLMDGVSSQQTTYAALGGSVTCTEISAQHAACTFSTNVEAVSTAFPPQHSLTGNLDAPSTCPDAGG